MTLPFGRYGLELRAVKSEDIETLRQWRNSARVCSQMLNQQHISEQQQQHWFAGLNDDKLNVHASITFRQELIGYVKLTPLKSEPSDVVESGLYIGHERYIGHMIGFLSGVLVSTYCFEVAQCEYMQATVLPGNQTAIRFNQGLGYHQWGRSSEGNILMRANDVEFREAISPYRSILERFNEPN